MGSDFINTLYNNGLISGVYEYQHQHTYIKHLRSVSIPTKTNQLNTVMTNYCRLLCTSIKVQHNREAIFTLSSGTCSISMKVISPNKMLFDWKTWKKGYVENGDLVPVN
ncbi:uncharacterized protein LOC110858939 [Folsomia candida]|uniref:uncharacterized protein LOC110858939 n=1 Tax=Folsomia candida TaxID=158441 RepID=UPI0016050CD5|nr:uncharacterized protein LOC110858939 [Folsomia candida]